MIGDLRQRQPREEDRAFLAFLRTQPCAVCGTPYNIEAAHVRYADAAAGKRETGRGEKPSDEYAVPLCVRHHRVGKLSQHSMGERAFWESHGIDALELAKKYRRDYEFFCDGP